MTDAEGRCPHCGGRLEYDAATGMMWCPTGECGFAVRADTRRAAGVHAGTRISSAPGYAGPDAADAEWSPEPRSRRRMVVVGLVAVLTVAAVLLLSLSPLLKLRPSLSVSPGELVFEDRTGVGVMPQALAVQNHGKGRLAWQVESDVEWLTIEPMSGSIDGELQIVTVMADTASLPEGTHSATLSVTAAGARNSPQLIEVEVQLLTPPEARAIRDLMGDGVEVYYDVQPPYVT